MKTKLFQLFLAIGMFYEGYAQVHTDGAGNVGIGTTVPLDKLDVRGDLLVANSTDNGNIGGKLTLRHTSKTALGLARDWVIYNMSGMYGNSLQFWAYDEIGCASGGTCDVRMVLTDNGKLGLGIMNPWAKLDVRTPGAGAEDENAINVQNPSSSAYSTVSISLGSGAYSSSKVSAQRAATSLGSSIFFQTSDAAGVVQPRLWINETGNVGIGTTVPQAKLSVNGDIFSKKIKVTQTAWADFVFAPTYQLRPVHELRTFIQTHRHLPDVPSEKEVTANGQDLGEMNKILLQKIEELTLYMIDQHETITELKARLSKLEQK